MSRVIPFSAIHPRFACPDCGRRSVDKSMTPEADLVSMNGGALWSVSERCIMCKWSRLIQHVRIGA